MTDNPRDGIERHRDRIQNSDDISEADADALIECSNQIDLLGASQYSDHRHEFILQRCLLLAERVGGLSDALEDRDAAEEIVRHINTRYDNPEYNKDMRNALRMFSELVTDGDGKPDSISWIPSGYPENYDPMPDPADMLRWDEDVQPLLDAARNSRDRALIAIAWDAGPRPHELFDLRVGNISDHKYGKQLTIEQGKKGSRAVLLIPSAPYVQRWLDDHPSGDPDDPLWCPINTARELSNNRVRDILKDRKADTDVTKPVTPSNFRKSSASHLARQGVSQAHLEDHHGWTRGSDIAARYISVSSSSNDRAVAAAHGMEVEADEPDPTAPVTCPRCERETPREKDLCVWCSQALEPEAIESLKQDAREVSRAAMKLAKENPELLEEAEVRRDILDGFAADEGLHERAKRYADANDIDLDI